ncbi:hypothetical protein BC834DRAFT_850568 [Gloeopeniophorella convolvens]|nr:hypothetical protein BC834DRAFT_850568 [Gloeopeniophorella convolvens]
MPSSPITCHVLDSSTGKPAVAAPPSMDGGPEVWEPLARGVTNADGRCLDLMTPADQHTDQKVTLKAGLYKIAFETKEYFDKAGKATFYPWVEIPFEIINPDEHYHVPLLISPFSYTTYRGS